MSRLAKLRRRSSPFYASSTVSAATVTAPSEAVLINESTRSVPLVGPPELAPGTRLMVNPSQVATIAYADTCVVKVGSGRVLTIQEAARPAPT